MSLKFETLKDDLNRFARAYGWPKHVDCDANKINDLADIYWEELSKHFNDETFHKAVTIAWTKARRFPVVADFFEGFGGAEKKQTLRLDTY